jgi:RNA polymerase sigma factor (sigma-70 family)
LKDEVLMNSVSTVSDSFKRRAKAAARVFCEHGGFISQTIKSYVEDEDQADELAQAFFISLVGRPVPLGVKNVKGYLYRAIVNDIADADRLTKRYQGLLHAYAERSKYPDAPKTPYESLMEAEEAKRVLELIQGRLPRSEATAVTLRHWEGDSVGQAAKRIGVENMTLKGYVSQGLSRARRLLRNIAAEAVE